MSLERRRHRSHQGFERHTSELSFAPTWEQLYELDARLRMARAKCWATFVVGIAAGAAVGYWVLPRWI